MRRGAGMLRMQSCCKIDESLWISSSFFISDVRCPPPLQVARNKLVSVVGANPPSDIASGRIAEVRRRNMSCKCMTRTSQQECQGILELKLGLADCKYPFNV